MTFERNGSLPTGIDNPIGSTANTTLSCTPTSVQSGLQSLPSPAGAPPLSHCSLLSTRPLPQNSTRQFRSQPSPFERSPSSHSSSPTATPLPHADGVQLVSQPSPSTSLP